MLCIGVYRLRDLIANASAQSPKRYVITNPADDLKLYSSDKIFVLQQFDPGLEYTPDNEDKYPLIRPVGTDHDLPSVGLKPPVTPQPGQRDPNSHVLLCSSVTDGPYSYIG